MNISNTGKGILMIAFSILSVFTYSQENTLDLSQAIEKTLANHYGILISKIDVEAAETVNTRGNAGGLPTIGFDINSQNSQRFPDGDPYMLNNLTADLGFGWKIFDGFKVRITMEKLQELENFSKGQSAVVIENSIQDVVMNYYYILLLQENLEVLEKLMQLSEDRYEYEKAKFDLGGTVSVNVLLAKNLWLNDRAAFLRQEIAVRDAMRTLNFLMAEKDNPFWMLTEDFAFEYKEYSASALIEKMLSDNQVLKNQYLNRQLKEIDRRIRETDRLPDLSMSGGVVNSYSRNSSTGSSNTFYPYLNLSFSYDIYTGGTRETAIKVAELEESISDIETEEMEHSLTNFMLSIVDNYELRHDLLEIAEENLQVAEMNLEIANEKYRNGSITSFEYRDIQLIYLYAAQSRLAAIYELINIETELTRLTGGFLSVE